MTAMGTAATSADSPKLPATGVRPDPTFVIPQDCPFLIEAHPPGRPGCAEHSAAVILIYIGRLYVKRLNDRVGT